MLAKYRNTFDRYEKNIIDNDLYVFLLPLPKLTSKNSLLCRQRQERSLDNEEMPSHAEENNLLIYRASLPKLTNENKEVFMCKTA